MKGKGSYAAALNAPFSEAALGAQIPDIFSYPTDTRHFRQTFVITTDVSGNWEGVLLPSPVFSIAAPWQVSVVGAASTASTLIATITGGNQVTVGSTTSGFAGTVPKSVVTGASSDTGAVTCMQVNGTTSCANLSNVFQQYRVVGWGYKMRAITSVNDTAGRVQIASIPAPRFLPDMGFFQNPSGSSVGGLPSAYPMYDFYTSLFGNFNTSANRAAIIDNFLAPVAKASLNGGFTGNLLDYPINTEVTSLQLASAPLRGHGKLTTREFESFREGQGLLGPETILVNPTNLATVDFLVYDGWSVQSNAGVLSNSNAVNTSHISLGPNSCAGWNAIPISIIGAKASTSAFEIEVIYHVEGVNPLQISGKPLGGKASHHNPIEAMAAETINGASGKYPLSSSLSLFFL